MNTRLSAFPIIDAHLHLWDTTRIEYPWLDEVPEIKKDYRIQDYQQTSSKFRIEKMVFVQCDCRTDQYMDELEFVIGQAAMDNRLQAVVAYAPLEQGENIKNVLEIYQRKPLVKGVRKMYDDSPEICVEKDFLNAVRLLPSYNLSLDISIKPASVKDTVRMVSLCPDTQIVLDHLGKPDIKSGALAEYKKGIDLFSSFPNVAAKISGLLTEANLNDWKQEDIKPYIDYAIERFGFDRLMYGGDWPVVLLAGTYNEWLETLYSCVEACSEEELQKLFYLTADRIYRLSE